MTQHNNHLESEFHEAMLVIYDAALRLRPPYHATYFRRMVLERGGRQAASDLLTTEDPSSGFTELYLRGRRLDLSVEYLVLKKPWRDLFSLEQLEVARMRLEKVGFLPPAEA